MEIQFREASHINAKYKEVGKSLLEDASRFESMIKQIEDDIRDQQFDIAKLQSVRY